MRVVKKSSYLGLASLFVSGLTFAPLATALTTQPGCVAREDVVNFSESQLSGNVFSGGVNGNDDRYDPATGKVFINTPLNGTTVAGGIVVLSVTGAFEYTPPAHYVGDDSFTYSLFWRDSPTKPVELCSSATVRLHINAANYVRLQAEDDRAATVSPTPVFVDPFQNDRYVRTAFQSTRIDTFVNTTPELGSFTLEANPVTYYPVFRFTPTPGVNGVATLRYTLADMYMNTSTAYVYVTVSSPAPVNSAPIARADTYSNFEDLSLTANVLSNDSDAEGDRLTVVSASQAAHGTVTMQGDGMFTYVPEANYFGTDSFQYTVSDGRLSMSQTVSIVVSPVNDAPVTTLSAQQIKKNAFAFSAAATDVDGTVSSYCWSYGDGSMVTSTSPTVTHAYKKRGSYTVTVVVTDNSGAQSAPVTMTVVR